MTDNRIVMWDVENTNTETPYQSYIFRSDLKDHVKKLKDHGQIVRGIVIDDTYNIELIVEEE